MMEQTIKLSSLAASLLTSLLRCLHRPTPVGHKTIGSASVLLAKGGLNDATKKLFANLSRSDFDDNGM